MSESEQDRAAPRTEGTLYGFLLGDMAISDGAFRLWHVLSGMAGKKGYCWPGRRGLAEKYGWSIRSLKPWVAQLVAHGYLRVDKPDRKKYPALPLGTNGVVYIPATRAVQARREAVALLGHSDVAQNGHSGCSIARRCVTNDHTTVSQMALPAVALLGHEIKSIELSKGTKGNVNGTAVAAPRPAPTEFFLTLDRKDQRIWGELGKLVPDRNKNLGWWQQCMSEDSECLAEILGELRAALLRGVKIDNPGGWLTRRWQQIGGEVPKGMDEIEPEY